MKLSLSFFLESHFAYDCENSQALSLGPETMTLVLFYRAKIPLKHPKRATTELLLNISKRIVARVIGSPFVLATVCLSACLKLTIFEFILKEGAQCSCLHIYRFKVQFFTTSN